jgi:hypothetical protein
MAMAIKHDLKETVILTEDHWIYLFASFQQFRGEKFPIGCLFNLTATSTTKRIILQLESNIYFI